MRPNNMSVNLKHHLCEHFCLSHVNGFSSAVVVCFKNEDKKLPLSHPADVLWFVLIKFKTKKKDMER